MAPTKWKISECQTSWKNTKNMSRKGQRWTKEEDDYLMMHLSLSTLEEMSEYHERSQFSIQTRLLKKACQEFREKYGIEEDVFARFLVFKR